MSASKPTLCLDFDGVLHAYTSGWRGATIIPDGPVPGAIEFLAEAVKRFRVAIYSSRSAEPGGIAAMQNFLQICALETCGNVPAWVAELYWPTSKPAAFVSIDDRALTFTGEWPPIEQLLAFKPWNAKQA